jgi:glycine betaine/proline transport system substrate-binding protein
MVLTLSLLLLMSGCGKEEQEIDESLQARREARSEHTLELVYPAWTSERASSHLFQAVLQERLGYRVELETVPVEEMWSSVASGEADILTGAWLPATHRDYFQTYGENLRDLGPNLEGAKIGLVVPTTTPGRQTEETGKTGKDLVTIRSLEELGDPENAARFDGRIVGIEAGSGVVARTEDALEAYGLERLYRLVETNEEGMLDRVADAIYRGEWIVFTGWKPHYIFELHDLTFLEDPEGVFGGEESIHTMVREGFEEDFSDAFEVLERISYRPEDLERLMRWIHEDEREDPYGQALRWIELHEEMVDSWVEGIE